MKNVCAQLEPEKSAQPQNGQQWDSVGVMAANASESSSIELPLSSPPHLNVSLES